MHIQIPEKCAFLYEPKRYKVAYGGRGAAKSWSYAIALLIIGIKSKKLILCAREFQSSIADSVHALLKSQIDKLGLNHFYKVYTTYIEGINGTRFIFAGLKHNINKIKSTEDVDICWVEEGQTVSYESWETLIPTIRKAGSEIWVSFNPLLATDETYQRFVLHSPPKCSLVEINWYDNPWFPEILREEKEYLKSRDYEAYLNVWEGKCKLTIDGAVYGKQLLLATKENRITTVTPIPGKPIDTFWDLGKQDFTAIIFAQIGMNEIRIVDFYQNQGQDLDHFFRVLQNKKYLYGMHYLPHDAKHDRLGSLTIEKQFKELYPNNVKTIERISNKKDGIAAVRTLFPTLWFNEATSQDLRQALSHYKYDIDDKGQYSLMPLHDHNSHAADALQTLAQATQIKTERRQPKLNNKSNHSHNSYDTGWMAS